jgi:MoaA/NifB/PqqE/SkfB family radical SAM enzyme
MEDLLLETALKYEIVEHPEPSAPYRGEGLDFLWLEITQHCNLRCRHCYTTSSPQRKHNNIDWASIIRQAHAIGCDKIQLIGGEPLTHPDFADYVRLCASLDFSFIEVFSNASLLSDEICALFAECKVNLATSFYSSSAAEHDSITLTQGSHAETVAGIGRAVGYGIPVRVGLITDANRLRAQTPDEVSDSLRLLESLGVDRNHIRFDSVRPVGRGAKMTPYVSQYETLCGACWNGRLAISFDGNCYPCVFSRNTTVGNIREQGLGEIVAAKTLARFRQDYYGSLVEQGHPAVASDDCTPTCEPAGCMPVCNPSDPSPCNPWGCGPLCGPGEPSCVPGNGCKPGGCLPGCIPKE